MNEITNVFGLTFIALMFLRVFSVPKNKLEYIFFPFVGGIIVTGFFALGKAMFFGGQ